MYAITTFIPVNTDYIGSEAAREPDTSKGVRPVRRGLSRKPTAEMRQGGGLPPYQCVSEDYPVSFVITDPKGTIVLETGKMLQRFGYRIKILNTINFKKSMRYNPFAYIHSEKDILKLVTTLIANTKGDQKSGDPFWEKSETLLYTALIAYLHYEAPERERNFATLAEMIGAMEVREEDEEFKNGATRIAA